MRGSDGIRVPVPYQPLCTGLVLVMERLDGRPLAAIDPGTPAGVRAALARSLLDCLLREVMLEGTFHADPHPGNVLLLTDGTLGLLDFGSVGCIDQGLRAALQRLLLALDRGDPAGLADALLEVAGRPGELDEPRLERMLGRFLARHVAAGITPDVRMFTDLFRIVSDHGLAVPPEMAAVFRALATMEGTLTQLAPGFDIVAEARRFAAGQLAAQFSPDVLHRPARPVRPRRQLPLRPVDFLGHRGGTDHGHVPHLPAGHARVPRTQGTLPAGTGGAGGQRADEHGGRRFLAPLGPGHRSPKGARCPRRPRLGGRDRAADLGLRLGTSDASTDPPGWTTHQAYAALAQGFGPGFNGPLELAAHVGSPADVTAFGQLLAAARTPGVAAVTPALTAPNGKVVLATLYPTTSPQASQTINLVNNLRNDLIPQAAHGTGLVVHVGGVTATNIDFSHVLTSKLPLFITVVVLLAFLLLMAVFRSLLIPLVASVMNLLSVGAALGALNAVFNWGWGSSLLRLSGTGPVDAFIPVLLFSVLFGLSMDYEVYLVSRIQEEWHHLHHTHTSALAALNGRASRRNHQAVTIGQAKSGRIIAAAAGIMILVFGSFLLGGSRILQEFGFGLGFSVLVDALLIRSLLVPAIMHLIGPANWALPGWLDRILPRLAIEAGEPAPATDPDAEMNPVRAR